VELPLALKRKVLYLYARKDEWNHYQVLQVPRDADAREIKRAYFHVSKDYHPDAYFRKNLGTFKERLETLFKRVGKAYEVLSDPAKRAKYDAGLPSDAKNEPQTARSEAQLKRDKRLKAEKLQRMLRRSPMAMRKAQARKHFEDAKQHREQKDEVRAANSIRLALTLDPDNAEYLELLDSVKDRAGEIRSEREFKRGRYEESIGRTEEALEFYRAALLANPNDTKALHRAALVLLSLNRDLKEALGYARRAREREPDNPEFIKTLADAYLAMGMTKNAQREYQSYLNLRPLDEYVQKLLRQI
jgi:curved DNA-binding protein CbpA